MILYLGTSSLVMLYLEEKYSDMVREWAGEAEIVATCRLAYTEMISALDKRFREKDLTKKDYELIIDGFSRDWVHFASVDFDEFEAGRLVKKYGLRRFDAIHLSAAMTIKNIRKDVSIRFSSLDEKLCRAAASEGLRVLTFG